MIPCSPAGYLLINKPKDITSFQVVRTIRRWLPRSTKIGHAGTLDPFATGLLIIGVGRSATRHFERLIHLDKVYRAQGELGVQTDSLDVTGTVVKNMEGPLPTKDSIALALAGLGTSYEQVPPVYSALKFQGKRLYALARSGKVDEQQMQAISQLKKRTVHLFSTALEDFQAPHFTVRAHVSHGTYIRSLMNDIAERANSFATTVELTRLAIGPFLLENAVELSAIKNSEDVAQHLVSIDAFLSRIKN